jgi:hypothetical protein
VGQRNKLEGIQGIVIDAEELLWVVREQMRIYEDGVKLDGFGEMGLTIGMVFNKYPNDMGRAYCIIERMSCLIGVLRDDRTRAFTSYHEDPSRLGVRREIFEAAAICAIHFNDDDAWFDTEEFIGLVLRLTNVTGQA